MKQQDFDMLLVDTTKQINGSIEWGKDDDHYPSVEFRAEVISQLKYPIFVKGSYNQIAQTLTYALIHQRYGRIYALDLGKDHHNPTCSTVGRKHKHRWTESFRDKEAYVPDDITALINDPVGVWQQFCKEALLTHDGVMYPPPLIQLTMELY
jgi:hypothetical protein